MFCDFVFAWMHECIHTPHWLLGIRDLEQGSCALWMISLWGGGRFSLICTGFEAGYIDISFGHKWTLDDLSSTCWTLQQGVASVVLVQEGNWGLNSPPPPHSFGWCIADPVII